MKKHLALAAIGTVTLMAQAHPIDFDKIQHWTGTGPNRAALVVQYNGDIYGDDAYVWGYRWENGTQPSGEDMFKAICANSSRLCLLTQFTGSMGSTVDGIGMSCGQKVLDNVFFDFEKAKNFEFINFDYYNADALYGQKEAPGDNAPAMAQSAIDAAAAGTHVIQHPFDALTYGYPAYDYDCWLLNDALFQGSASTDNKWRAAWYEGYWSYWCASPTGDEFMYSGAGYSSRKLSDGCVDGWSFTQFENAQVGGMGEGVAPCEGSVIYMPAKAPADVDASKAVFSVGDGANTLPVVISWGNGYKLDNLVYAYNFTGEIPGIAEIVGAISEADPRLSATMNGDAVQGLAYDADDDGTTTGYLDPSAEGAWKATEYEDAIAIHIADFAPEYLLYRPVSGTPGVWLPEAISRHLSDTADNLPMFVQREFTGQGGNYMYYRRSDDALTHSNTSSDIVSSISTTNASIGKLTYKGDKTGKLYIHVRFRVGSSGTKYVYSNVCAFTLLDPEKPVTGISFTYPEMQMPLNTAIDNPLIIEPADATYTKLTYKSSDTKVATASASAMKTTTTPGSATISVSYALNPEISTSFDLSSSLVNPVTGLNVKGVDGDVIVLNPKEMIGIICDVEPADADIADFDVTISGNGDSKDNYIATMYKVNYWDENNTRIQFYELSGHRAGECTLTLKAKDAEQYTRTYTVRVEEPDRTPLENGYTDGTIMLNEEWFGHTNGGLNYITPDYDIIYQAYERENPGMSFGCTSQYGTIWAGKLLVASKQAIDGGDPLPGGGRLVVADATTLKRIGSIDNLVFDGETRSGDGRAIAGATPSKVYIGTTQGIYIIDIDEVKVIGKIKGESESESDADLYNGQIGDMVHAGDYVFAIKQSDGIYIIDTRTDLIVKHVSDAGVQGVTQSADGNVWVATVVDGASRFVCYDPESLDELSDMSVTMPATLGTVTCSWGAWRSTQFFGCQSENCLWFVTGGSGIAGGSNGGYYRWYIGTDAADAELVFDLNGANLEGSNSCVKQKTYGTSRYDDRTGELIVMTCDDSASGHYRYNWYHYIDPATHRIVRTLTPRPYYWFQSLPIFPDKYDAALADDFGEVKLAMSRPEGKTIDLREFVSDADNHDANIRFSLPAANALADEAETPGSAAATLDGSKLTLVPTATGKTNVLVEAQSNGRVATLSIPVNVRLTSGIDDAAEDAANIRIADNRAYIYGYAGTDFAVYNAAGVLLTRFTADTDAYVAQFGFEPGVYVLSAKGVSVKFIVR